MIIRLPGTLALAFGAGIILMLGGCSASKDTASAAKPPTAAEQKKARRALAESGDREAQFLLGFELCCGDGGEDGRRNLPEATVWLCQAAHQGEPRARFRLGQIYARDLDDSSLTAKMKRSLGFGASDRARPRLAAMWYDLAMAGGHDAAAHNRLVLNKSMTAEDQRAVERMRANWREMPCRWRDVYRDGTSAK